MRRVVVVVIVLTALVMVGPGAIALAGLMMVGNPAADTSCGPGGAAVTPTGEAPASIAGYSGSQLENAAAIMRAGLALEVGLHGQRVAVMTAMGESSLINVNYGDAVGPDSRGLFQQRDNGAWGSYEDRMDPYTAATNFYRALLKVDDWEVLPPTVAAHRTQRNADVNHYARYWDGAVEIVDTLAGNLTGYYPETTCEPSGGSVTAQGWTNPAQGRLSSRFGSRAHPVTGVTGHHSGTDVANSCGTPIRAAAAGTILRAAPGPHQGRTGNQIIIDHGGVVTTRYGHVLSGTMTVQPGDQVTAGHLIARMGGDPATDPVGAGSSTGCHLHFEVNLNGRAIEPTAYLLAQGVVLGAD